MAWLRGSASATTTNGGNPSIDLTTIADLSEGDVVYVLGAIPTTTAGLALPGDWSTLDEQNSGSGRGIIGRKVMGPIPDASVVLTGDADAGSSVGFIAVALAGVDTTTPEDGVSIVFASGSSTNPDPGSITPGSTGGIALIMAWSRVNDSTKTAPTGYTEVVDIAASADTNDVSLYGAYKFGMVSGVAENPDAIGSWSTGDWGAWTISVRTSADQPRLRGFATGSNTNGGNVTIDLTTISGLAENDVVFLMGAAGETSANIALPGDWNIVDEQSNLSASRGIIGWKAMGASVDTSVVITNNGGSTSATTGMAVAFYNVDTTTPFDGVTPTYANVASGTAPNNPSITPGSSNSLVIAASYCQVNDTAVTPPTNYLYVGGVGSTDTTPTSINIAIRGGRVASVAENPDAWGGWSGHSGNWSIVLRKSSGNAVSGTIAQTLTKLAQAATGAVSPRGAIAQALPRLAQALAGTERFTGTAASGLPRLAQAASASVANPVTGSIDQVLPVLAQAASGTAGAAGVSGTITQILPRAAQALSGTESFTGTSAQVLPKLAQAASGQERFTGTIAQTLAKIGQAVAGSNGYQAVVAQTLARIAQAASGALAFVGSVVQYLPGLRQELLGSGGTIPDPVPTDIASAAFLILGPNCVLDVMGGSSAFQIMGPSNDLDIDSGSAVLQTMGGSAKLVIET